MKKVLLIILVLNFNNVLANTNTQKQKLEETKRVLKTLLPFQKKGTKNTFLIDKCKIDKSKWMLLLIAKQPFTEKIIFNRGCHIQGQFTAKMGIPFPTSFKLQKLENFNHVKFNFLIQLEYEPVPMIKVFMQNGILTGKKDKIKFNLEYAAEVDSLSKDFIKKDKGGKITISSINGKKMKQIIPIKI
tara:strand:+ start:61 stop:621 length:561 start_codon:yes stop_codon:yes gene_type:complete